MGRHGRLGSMTCRRWLGEIVWLMAREGKKK